MSDPMHLLLALYGSHVAHRQGPWSKTYSIDLDRSWSLYINFHSHNMTGGHYARPCHALWCL